MTRLMMAALLAATAGCAMHRDVGAGPTPPGSAVAELRDASGASVGRAVASDDGGRVRVALDAVAMPAGVHGAHVHTTGKCDGPDFVSAGGHWNPGGMHHGSMNPEGPHAGDLPNLTIASDGRGSLVMTLPSGTLDQMLDADGAALVIHAGPDDLKSDPAGNSGARLACGVFRRV